VDNELTSYRTVHQSWVHLLDKTESIATQHATISEQLETSLRKSVKYRAKDNEKQAKQVRFCDIAPIKHSLIPKEIR
jgi:hypothetical protein